MHMCKLCVYIMLSYHYLANLVVVRPCHASTSSMEASTSRPSFENDDHDDQSLEIPTASSPAIWNWSRPERLDVSELVRIGWRKDKWISPGNRRLWKAGSAQCLLTCHTALPRMEYCRHLLTSVDCESYERSMYYERITKVSVGFLCPALLIERHQGGTTIRKSGTAKQHLIWPRHPRPQRIVARRGTSWQVVARRGTCSAHVAEIRTVYRARDDDRAIEMPGRATRRTLELCRNSSQLGSRWSLDDL